MLGPRNFDNGIWWMKIPVEWHHYLENYLKNQGI